MRFYREYFKKEIKRLTTIFLLISILSILFDQVLNHDNYPIWISWLNFSIMITASILTLLSLLKKIETRNAFLIFIYLFTLNIYIPGFIGNDVMQAAIVSSFSNIGACMIYLLIAGLIGAGIHVLILGSINILFICAILWSGKHLRGTDISSDPVNILMFIVTSLLVYIMFRYIEKSLVENEENKKKINQQKTEILNLRIEEERKRNYFLSIIQSENDLFTSKVISSLSSIVNTDKDEERTRQLTDLQQLCIVQGYKASKTDNVRWHTETDAGFITQLKNTCPELTYKEQHICSLIRVMLSTKEIADNMNMSAETIKWYRKRIKKKLKLDEGQNLNSFS